MNKTTQVEDAAENVMIHFIQTTVVGTAIHESREYARNQTHLMIEDQLRWTNDQEPIYGVQSNPEE